MHNLKFLRIPRKHSSRSGASPTVGSDSRDNEDADALYDDTGHHIPVIHPVLPVVVSEDAGLSSEHGPLPPASAKNGRDKSNAGANVQLAWNGFRLVSRNLEQFLDGTPFKTPIALLNAIINIGDTVAANKDGVHDLVDRTKHRLEMINAALLKTENRVAAERIERFSRVLIVHANELVGLLTRSLSRRIWESDEDVEKVKEIFVHIDECAKDFHIDISLHIERQTTAIFESIRQLQLSTWPRSRQAVYNADIDSTLTRRQCTPGTRTAIIDTILEWTKDNSSAPIYWLNGLAGTGKSTIAYTICKLVDNPKDNILLASFFCSRQIEDSRRRKHIIPTIVYQLARRSRSYAGLLMEADFDAVDSSKRHMQELLVDPWIKSIDERPADLPPRLVVIDALDECEEGYEFLRELLDVVQRGGLPGLKFLVTSRPDPKIVAQCDGFAPDAVCYLHEVDTKDVQADVRTFLTKELPALRQKPQFEELVEQAGGLFIYAATAVRFILPDKLSEKEQEAQLKVLLKAQPVRGSKDANPFLLDDLYRGVLREGLLISHGETIWHRRLSILHTILRVDAPVTCMVISGLFCLNDTADVDEEMVRQVVDALHSFLYISRDDGCIYWYHQSFYDLMSDDERAWIPLDDGSLTTIGRYNTPTQSPIILRACLHIMRSYLEDPVLAEEQFKMFSQIVEQSSSHGTPLAWLAFNFRKLPESQRYANDVLKYACENWVSYLVDIPYHTDFHFVYNEVINFVHSPKVLSYIDTNPNRSIACGVFDAVMGWICWFHRCVEKGEHLHRKFSPIPYSAHISEGGEDDRMKSHQLDALILKLKTFDSTVIASIACSWTTRNA